MISKDFILYGFEKGQWFSKFDLIWFWTGQCFSKIRGQWFSEVKNNHGAPFFTWFWVPKNLIFRHPIDLSLNIHRYFSLFYVYNFVSIYLARKFQLLNQLREIPPFFINCFGLPIYRNHQRFYCDRVWSKNK